MNCYKVRVKTTNSTNDTFSVTTEGHYYHCENSICFVVANNMAEVEGYFNSTSNIESIERIGIGYCPELYKDCLLKSQK